MQDGLTEQQGPTLWEAIDATKHAANLWGLFLYPYASAFSNMVWFVLQQCYWALKAVSVVVWPYLEKFADIAADQIRRTDPVVLASIPIGLISLIIVWWLGRIWARKAYQSYKRTAAKVKAKYDEVVLTVSQKSRVLADLLPHILLIIAWVLSIYLVPGVMTSLAHPFIVLATGTLLPAVQSVQALSTKDAKHVVECLTYWVVFGTLSIIIALGGNMLHFIPKWAEFKFLFFLWLQFGWTSGALLSYHFLVPLINNNIKQIKIQSAEEQGNMIINLLARSNVISNETKNRLLTLLVDAGYILLGGCIFFFTPGFLTRYGILLVGYAYPIYASIMALGNSTERGSDLRMERLRYWAVFSTANVIVEWAETVIGSSIPLWYHAKLAGIIWLQLFHGANRLYLWCLTHAIEFWEGGVRRRSSSAGFDQLGITKQAPDKESKITTSTNESNPLKRTKANVNTDVGPKPRGKELLS